MASQTVFNTTELTEGILALLPLPSLLRVQAVCKQWRAVIQDSSLLQQQLFLQPAKDETVWLVDILNLPAQQHPLRRDFRSFIQVKAAVPRKSKALKTHHGLIVTPVRVNPLFLCSLDTPGGAANIDLRAERGAAAEFSLPWSEMKSLEGHSAQGMFLTQPPVQHLSLEVNIRHEAAGMSTEDNILQQRSSYGEHSIQVSNEGGIQLWNIISALDGMETSGLINEIFFYMKGVVEISDSDEEVIKERTSKWPDKALSVHQK